MSKLQSCSKHLVKADGLGRQVKERGQGDEWLQIST